MLYIIATPIGHLGDITYRAVETLAKVDRIFCEDTRKTRILLRHYQIDRPLSSYHLFNEKKKLEKILSLLEEGKEIALVSDAGLPCLQDPGGLLLAHLIEKEIPITILPGPSSILQGYLSSGLLHEKFQFIGFLPKKIGKRKKELEKALEYPGTTIAFESPHRLHKTLKDLTEVSPKANIAICREMTKRHEEIKRGRPEELLEYYTKKKPKGEITLILEGSP